MRRFTELIRIAIGRKEGFDAVPTPDEWASLVETARKQALTGVAFAAIERLPRDQRPPRDIILGMFMQAQRVEKGNMRLTEASVRIAERLSSDGFHACILKGQGNAVIYPEHLRRRRMSGDVDVWTLPVGVGEKDADDAIREVIAYIHRYTPGTKATYHHIDFPAVKDVEIEVHYRPAFLYTPYRNRRLQRWFLDKAQEQFRNKVSTDCGTFAMPTREFNIVFQLCHIYKHIFEEGVGLRQLMDYYYVLTNSKRNVREEQDAVRIIRSSGMHRFARAVMWVMQEVFGMEDEFLYTAPDPDAGRLLLEEIEATGNFGHMDTRFGDKSGESNWHRIVRVVGYDLKFFRYYPEEVIWNPLFKLYHWWWRKRMN